MKGPASDGPLVKVASAPKENASELAGWLVEGAMPGAAYDRDRPGKSPFRGGELEVQLAAAAASVVSESFVPNNHSSLTIEAFFRLVATGHQSPRLDRGRFRRQALRPPNRDDCVNGMGGAGGARLGRAGRRARFGPTAIRAACRRAISGSTICTFPTRQRPDRAS